MPYSRERVRKPRVQEAAVTGLILLVFLGILVGYAWTRLRGRMKLNVSGKNWAAAVVIFVFVILMLWASHNGH
jgi:succinate dehydrogenase hydrophobic anchor subunit